MSITWMLVVAGVIVADKVLPAGERLSQVFAVAFVAVGIWVAASPSSFPGLAQPGSPQVMQAMRAMDMHGMQMGTAMQKTHGTGAQKTHSVGMPKSTSMKMK
jgi:hypothetical protein